MQLENNEKLQQESPIGLNSFTNDDSYSGVNSPEINIDSFYSDEFRQEQGKDIIAYMEQNQYNQNSEPTRRTNDNNQSLEGVKTSKSSPIIKTLSSDFPSIKGGKVESEADLGQKFFNAINKSEGLNAIEDTGIGTINSENKTILIESEFVFYGQGEQGIIKDYSAFSQQIAEKVQNDWNAPKATVIFEGQEYVIQFRITARYINDEKEVNKEIKKNNDFRKNYIRFFDSISMPSHSSFHDNTAAWNVKQLLSTDLSTASHEYGHMMGYFIPEEDRAKQMVSGMHDVGQLAENKKETVLSIMTSAPNEKEQGATPFDYPQNYSLPPYGEEFTKLNEKGDKIADYSKRIVTDKDVERLNAVWTSIAMYKKNNQIIMGQLGNKKRTEDSSFLLKGTKQYNTHNAFGGMSSFYRGEKREN